MGNPNIANPLTKDRITALMAAARIRGGHPTYIAQHFNNGEAYNLVNDHAFYAGKTSEQLKAAMQGLNGALKNYVRDNAPTPNEDGSITPLPFYKFVWDPDSEQLWFVNLDLHAVIEANATSTDEDSEVAELTASE